MWKEIKKWGNSAVIILTKEELKVRKLEIGDVVNIGDLVKIKKMKRGNKNGRI